MTHYILINKLIPLLNSNLSAKNICAPSLFFDKKYEGLIAKYNEYIDIDNNLYFRSLIKSLLPIHKRYLIEKYKSIENLKNFEHFPYSDKNFICLLYSLTIINDYKYNNFITYFDGFLDSLDNLSLTSSCKLLSEKIHNSNNKTFIIFEPIDSIFVNEYLQFYNFNKIFIKNLIMYTRETHSH